MLSIAAAIFSGLLVVTGVAKVARPEPTAKAIAELGLPVWPSLGRALGITEVVVGVTAIALGGAWAWSAQAALYLGFSVWVAIALRAGTPIATCGCLGSPDTPPYWGHLAVDVGAVALSAGAAVGRAPSPLVGEPLHVVTAVVLIAVGTALGWSLIGDGARVHGLARA